MLAKAPPLCVAEPDISTYSLASKSSTITLNFILPPVSFALVTYELDMCDILSGRCGLGKVLERFPRSWQVALALVEVKGLGSGGVCFGGLACRGEDVREFEQGIGVLAQQVGLRGEGRRRAREFLGFAVTAPVGEDPCVKPLADGLRGQVLVGCGFPAYRDQLDGFVVPARSLRGD